MGKIIQFNPYLRQYRQMWKDDRWKFSGLYVRLNTKKAKRGLDESEQMILDTMDNVVKENNSDWLKGYFYSEGVLTKTRT